MLRYGLAQQQLPLPHLQLLEPKGQLQNSSGESEETGFGRSRLWIFFFFCFSSVDPAPESSSQTLSAADGFCSLLSPLVYGNVFLLTELAHSFSRTNCSTLRQELAVF